MILAAARVAIIKGIEFAIKGIMAVLVTSGSSAAAILVTAIIICVNIYASHL